MSSLDDKKKYLLRIRIGLLKKNLLQMMNSSLEKKNFHIWILLSALVGRVC